MATPDPTPARLSTRSKLLLGGLVLLLGVAAVFIFASQSRPESTVPVIAITATTIPTATSLPTPTLIPSPTPLPQVWVEIVSSADVLPANPRATANLTITIHDAEQVELTDLTLYLQLEGGGMVTPVSQAVSDSTLNAVYTAGETTDSTTIVVTAVLDIPYQGRVTASTNLKIVRETLELELPCAYLLPHSPESIPLVFHLRSSMAGEGYPLQVQLMGSNPGALSRSPEESGKASLQFETNLGTVTLYYIPPATIPLGSTDFCVTLLDRPSQAPVCVPLVWGGGASNLTLRLRENTSWSWGVWSVVWTSTFDSVRRFLPSLAVLSYEPVATLNDPTQAHLLFEEAKTPWQPNTCHVLPLTKGTLATTFEPLDQTSAIRWQLQTLGVDNFILNREGFSIVGADRVKLKSFSTPIILEGGELYIDNNQGQADLRLFTVDPYQADRHETAVLVRFFVPPQNVDGKRIAPTAGETYIPLRTSLENPQTAPHGRLITDGLQVAYTYPATLAGNPAEIWYEVYSFAQVETSALYTINLNE